MKHSDFEIGKTFWTGSGEWLCTDKGTRVITAVRADDTDNPPGTKVFVGEHVFNEYDMGGCYREPPANQRVEH